MVKRLLTEDDHRRVSAAVAAAETRTSGEIVTVVAARSDKYRDAALQWGVLAMLAVPPAMAMLSPRAIAVLHGWFGGWGDGTPDAVPLVALVAAMAVAFLIVRYLVAWPPLLRWMTPGTTFDRRVRARALDHFRVGAEWRTAGRTAVLIYVSMFEHRCEVVADAAIHSKVSPEEWREVARVLVEGLRDGRAADGLIGAVEKAAALLALHFPPDAANPNELPDRLIELPA